MTSEEKRFILCRNKHCKLKLKKYVKVIKLLLNKDNKDKSTMKKISVNLKLCMKEYNKCMKKHCNKELINLAKMYGKKAEETQKCEMKHCKKITLEKENQIKKYIKEVSNLVKKCKMKHKHKNSKDFEKCKNENKLKLNILFKKLEKIFNKQYLCSKKHKCIK